MSDLMKGKRGLVMGVANDHSIAWGVARTLHAHGAELAFTYQGESFGRRVQPLAESVNATHLLPADVQDSASLESLFERLAADWGQMDFLIHAIAYSDKTELSGRFLNTTRTNFLNSLDISCYSLVDITRRAAPLMRPGGSVITLTYLGAQRVMPNYNVMGVAKAALESSVRYLANDLGPDGIRVNAISPGPMRTLAGSAIGGARKVYRQVEQNAPLRSNASLDSVGGAALYLASDLGACTTGEIIFVDGGYHAIGMPQPENL
ncbi:enoyl-ACP reductase [Paroceanicella profunda]|uniref:Enoyl-[acyl-carrier-protein] reductase [NADH] n=1 Tax=Paroceanicella profunda TaxID=2579971 RepID=A0A5B8FYH6_9RHOB|nr:enoyl-ACP reductase [Paroceanicella profunda]QDL91602.1 enoyl-ACP reductase [Paroceanicella profunda]